MKTELLIAYTHCIRTFTGIIAVGAAIAYYFSQVKQNPFTTIILSESLYISSLIVFITIMYWRLSYAKEKRE